MVRHATIVYDLAANHYWVTCGKSVLKSFFFLLFSLLENRFLRRFTKYGFT